MSVSATYCIVFGNTLRYFRKHSLDTLAASHVSTHFPCRPSPTIPWWPHSPSLDTAPMGHAIVVSLVASPLFSRSRTFLFVLLTYGVFRGFYLFILPIKVFRGVFISFIFCRYFAGYFFDTDIFLLQLSSILLSANSFVAIALSRWCLPPSLLDIASLTTFEDNADDATVDRSKVPCSTNLRFLLIFCRCRC